MDARANNTHSVRGSVGAHVFSWNAQTRTSIDNAPLAIIIITITRRVIIIITINIVVSLHAQFGRRRCVAWQCDWTLLGSNKMHSNYALKRLRISQTTAKRTQSLYN